MIGEFVLLVCTKKVLHFNNEITFPILERKSQKPSAIKNAKAQLTKYIFFP